MSQSKSKLARALETIADLRRQLKQQAGTPSATWAADGEPDPHGNRYNCERAELALGDLTDDQLANGAFMNYDRRLDINAILNAEPGYHSPIAWMTAVKDRIRWLSRSLTAKSADYDALLAERDAILLQARIWAGEAKSQKATVDEIGKILGGVPDWGPIAAGVEQLKKDAERYRWIARQLDAWSVLGEFYGIPSEHEGIENLSEAIDAALQGEQP